MKQNHPQQANKTQQRQDLLKHPNLWRAGQLAHTPTATQASGFAELDQHLPGGGWPTAGLVEFMLPRAGMGELRLLLPALQAFSRQQSIVWINPPFVPYAPALQALGVDLRRMLLVYPPSHKDALWAFQRACQARACGAVLAWLDEQKLQVKDTQRLQFTARYSRTMACVFRPRHPHHSMAELRLNLVDLQAGELQLDIAKRRGGWPIQNIVLPLAANTHTQISSGDTVARQLHLWRFHRQGLPVPATAEPADSGPLLPPSSTAKQPAALH